MSLHSSTAHIDLFSGSKQSGGKQRRPCHSAKVTPAVQLLAHRVPVISDPALNGNGNGEVRERLFTGVGEMAASMD